MIDRLKSNNKFEEIKKDNKLGALLTKIKTVSNEFEADLPLHEGLGKTQTKFKTYKQGQYDTNAMHIKNCKANYDMIR